jgi:hypothetical protein
MFTLIISEKGLVQGGVGLVLALLQRYLTTALVERRLWNRLPGSAVSTLNSVPVLSPRGASSIRFRKMGLIFQS